MADILGIRCGRGDIEESTAVGAAILATYGAGEFDDIEKAADQMANITHFWEPNPANREKYEQLFVLAEKLYNTLNDAHLYFDLKESQTQS